MAANLRTATIDRRRRETKGYNTSNARNAVRRVKAFRASNSQQQKLEPFRTEQRPGTGGFGSGLQTQIMRNQQIGAERRRAESFRPETEIKREVYQSLFN
tara:strand:- start:888 stop:1187 length:300 start_codon:yes stop_codon:yes gene_type:complete